MAELIFAPWRGPFIRGPKEKGCVFCRLLAEKKDRTNLILHRAQHNFIVLNRFPYTSGHLMIVPNRHIANLEKAPPEVLQELILLSRLSVKAIKSEFSPSGFNVGMNLGRTGGAGIVGHIHLHIVPRWTGDSNFMATTGGTRVISLPMDEVFASLRKHFTKP